MNIKKYFPFVLAGFFFITVTFFLNAEALAAKKKTKRYKVSAKSAILYDSGRSKVLYGKNIRRRVSPASTAKIMTALVVLEKLPLDKIIPIGKNATLVAPSKINLKTKEAYRVSDLLYALLLNSANDAAVVLAEAVAGSQSAFVQLMNERARQIGCAHTHFANPHGLPSNGSQYTSAYDMSLIFRQALKKDFFRKAVGTSYKTIYSRQGRKISLKNHNKLLWTKWGKGIYGKTGYTRKAGACFIGYLQKGKKTLIVGVFGCTKRWYDIRHIIGHYGRIW